MKIFPTATPLASAKRKGDNKPQVCIWTNQYGKGGCHLGEGLRCPEAADSRQK